MLSAVTELTQFAQEAPMSADQRAKYAQLIQEHLNMTGSVTDAIREAMVDALFTSATTPADVLKITEGLQAATPKLIEDHRGHFNRGIVTRALFDHSTSHDSAEVGSAYDMVLKSTPLTDPIKRTAFLVGMAKEQISQIFLVSQGEVGANDRTRLTAINIRANPQDRKALRAFITAFPHHYAASQGKHAELALRDFIPPEPQAAAAK